MTTDAFSAVVANVEDAHVAARRGYAHAKALLANGENVKITVEPAEESIEVLQRGFLHGPVLTQISEQVRVNGERYTIDIWKRYFKNLILEREPKYEMVRMPGAKRATPRRVYRSTEDMGPRAYSKFIDEVIDYAVVEWSVQFVFKPKEREGVRYYPPRKRSKPEEHHAETP